MMKFVLFGVLSFIILYLFDLFTLNNRKVMKRVFGIIGVGLIIYSSVMIILSHDTICIPLFFKVISGVFFIVALFLLIYSLFLELPFVNTYGKNDHNNDLVDTGTYALCRHPGVIWFGFMFLFLFLSTGNILVLIAGIIWTSIDIFYVYLQEKFIFKKMFTGYENYINTTPMLIPTKESIKKFKKTVFKY